MAPVPATGALCAHPSVSTMQVTTTNNRVVLLSNQELAGQTFRIGSKAARVPSGAKMVCQSLGERTRKPDAAPSNIETSEENSKDFPDEFSNIDYSNEFAGFIQQETKISPTLASRWREIQGANNWEGLMNPLDMDLRMELIRYGEFAQSCYDAFDNQPHSKYMGSSLFNKDTMFEKVGLPDTGYEITDYLFATTSVDSFILRNEAPEAWSRNSNWIGYIAVCVDEEKIKLLGRRDIVLAWRGTATKLEWAANLARTLVPCCLDPRASDPVPWNMKVKIEEGFLNLYTTANSQTRYNRDSVRIQILKELKRLIQTYDNEELSITITGHSLGGAMAVLSGYGIAMSGINRHGCNTDLKPFEEQTEPTPTSNPGTTKDASSRGSIPITAFTFAGPRVGNNPFADKVHELGVKILRVTNEHDMIPKVPSPLLNEEFTIFNNILDKFPWTYSHVGVEIQLNHDLSPDLCRRGNPVNAHNMEAYLHLLTGYHGVGRGWDVVVDRDLALVNKASDFVCPKRTGIPTHWWQPENKGLVRDQRGRWVQIERDYEDLPDHVLKEREEKKVEMKKEMERRRAKYLAMRAKSGNGNGNGNSSYGNRSSKRTSNDNQLVHAADNAAQYMMFTCE